MSIPFRIRTVANWLAAGAGFAFGAYAAYAATSWVRYGRPAKPPSDWVSDPILNRFMPEYEVVERHSVRVAAPAGDTFRAACEMDLSESAIVRAIFRTREFALGSKPEKPALAGGLLEQCKALGWGVLAEVPEREVVMGAVTQPWLREIVFRALPPELFAGFDEPGYVKIAWTLRSDPDGPAASIHRTETRVSTTGAAARRKFRGYWAVFSPGIVVIRRIGLHLVRRKGSEALLRTRREP